MELNLAETAEAFGVALKTARGWFNQGCPVITRGGRTQAWVIDSAAVSNWLRERERQAVAGDIQQMDLEDARRRKLAAEAELAELDLAQKRREVIPIEHATKVLTKENQATRAKLLALPTKLAARFPAKIRTKLREDLDDGIRECLEELSASPISGADGGKA